MSYDDSLHQFSQLWPMALATLFGYKNRRSARYFTYKLNTLRQLSCNIVSCSFYDSRHLSIRVFGWKKKCFFPPTSTEFFI